MLSFLVAGTVREDGKGGGRVTAAADGDRATMAADVTGRTGWNWAEHITLALWQRMAPKPPAKATSC